jgi:hypothetical protein
VSWVSAIIMNCRALIVRTTPRIADACALEYAGATFGIDAMMLLASLILLYSWSHSHCDQKKSLNAIGVSPRPSVIHRGSVLVKFPASRPNALEAKI